MYSPSYLPILASGRFFPFEISVPLDSPLVMSHPYHIDTIVAENMDAIFDEYLTAGLIQHSTSPYVIPVVISPKKCGGIRLTTNYKKLNIINILGQLPFPCVYEVLEKLEIG